MALGSVSGQARFDNPRAVLGDRLAGLYRFLADEGERLFGDDYFSDLYTRSRLGRPTVPARVVATVMVLQAFEGLSDREAVDRLARDLAWQAAAGVDLGYDAFHSTVLVGVRNRLRASDRPKRFLDDTRVMARESGVLRDRLRVLDSTPIYDAVTTEDTITQVRAAVRKMLAALRVEYPVLAVAAKGACTRDDEYLSAGRPPCDWDDRDAKEELVDALVRDANAILGVLDGHVLTGVAADAAELLAIVAGQDVERDENGLFRIVYGVARDRIISTVDPEARHGHKSRSRRFDGYKGHVSIDPESELIDEVVVTPANTADQDAAVDLVEPCVGLDVKPVVMGDSAYAGGALRERLGQAGFGVHAKVPPASNRAGLLSKDHFEIDLEHDTVWCLNNMDAQIMWHSDGTGTAAFGGVCQECVYRDECTTATGGRTISISRYEARILKAKLDQQAPQWRAEYRAQRPKVERKIGHLTRKIHGGRKARTRGLKRVLTDFVTRAAAINLARLHTLGVTHNGTVWATR
jgi:Transposase DDE domain/Transposase domain (DUF772)